MSRIELPRYALACALAFWVLDGAPILIRRFLIGSDQVSLVIWRGIVGSAFDLALAAAAVYLTVPLLARHYLPRTSDSRDTPRGTH
jgi:hypothetical protein